MLYYKRTYLQILFFFLIGLTFSCKKNKNHPIPSIPFDITIYTNLPSYNALESVGGWAYTSGGSKGIVIYRKSIEEFVAFDRHSPANEGSCEYPISCNKDNFLQLDDSCSAATFSLFDGSPISNSEYGLREYQTFWNGSNNLRIYN
jgi:hypothetical protein